MIGDARPSVRIERERARAFRLDFRNEIEIALLALAYVAVAKAGLTLDAVNRFAALVWPPSGLALAALLLGGTRLWAGVFWGALAINLWQGAPIGVASGIAVGNALQAVVGAYVMRRWGAFERSFENVRHVFALTLGAALLSTLVGATFGVASLAIGGSVDTAQHASVTWRVWWIGNALGDLIVGAFLLSWARAERVELGRARRAEAALLTIVLCAIGVAIFFSPPIRGSPVVSPYVIFPVLIWAALRFGLRGATLATALAATFTIWGTMRALGPFTREDLTRSERLLDAQTFMGWAAVTSLFVAGVTLDRLRAIAASERAKNLATEKEERFRALVSAAAQIVWTMEADGLVAEDSPAWRAFTGQTPEQRTGRGWLDVVHPDDRARVDAMWRQAVAAKTTFTTEHRVRHKSGEWRWTSVRAAPLLDADGSVKRWIAISTDITDRKNAEEQLRSSEVRLSSIVSLAAESIISIDEDQIIVFFNEGAEQTFGWKREEVVGRPLDVLLPERFRARHHGHILSFASERAAARPMGARREIFGLRKDGTEFPAKAAISKLRIGGRWVLTAILHDISEAKRIEGEQRLLARVGAAMAETLEYDETVKVIAREMLAFPADWCFVVVKEDVLLRRVAVAAADPSKIEIAARLQGLPLDETGARLTRVLFESRRPQVVTDLTGEWLASLGEDAEQRQLVEAVSPKSMLGVPMLAHGRLVGALSLISSRDDRRYTSADLPLAVELAHRAALAVENAALYKAAQDASRARDEMLGVVAHDLRNPLNAILVQAELLLRARKDDAHARIEPDRIRRAALRMKRLIQDLLDVTKMEVSELPLDRREVPAETLLSEALEMQKALIASAGLELELAVAPDLPTVSADRDRLSQVIENLVGNSIKFTQPGGRITVGAMPEGGEVLFWVADTGRGIPPEHMPHVFDRFWQAKKGEHGGVGLGLPIARGIIAAHGGRIWFESTMGHGTTCYFTIPLAKPP